MEKLGLVGYKYLHRFIMDYNKHDLMCRGLVEPIKVTFINGRRFVIPVEICGYEQDGSKIALVPCPGCNQRGADEWDLPLQTKSLDFKL